MMFEWGHGDGYPEYGNLIGGGFRDDSDSGTGLGDGGGATYGDGDGHGTEDNDGNGYGVGYEIGYKDGGGEGVGKENSRCTYTINGDIKYFICQQVMVGL